jgi:Phage integrase family
MSWWKCARGLSPGPAAIPNLANRSGCAAGSGGGCCSWLRPVRVGHQVRRQPRRDLRDRQRRSAERARVAGDRLVRAVPVSTDDHQVRRARRERDAEGRRREAAGHGQPPAMARTAPSIAPVEESANAARTVPLPTVAAEALAAHIAQFPPAPDGTVFTTAAGRPWSAGGMLRPAYSAAAAAAGLPEGTSSHDLRHHYASVLLAAGESVHAVAERIGDTPAMVLAVYGHVMPDQEDTTRRASTRPGQMCPVCARLQRPSRSDAVEAHAATIRARGPGCRISRRERPIRPQSPARAGADRPGRRDDARPGCAEPGVPSRCAEPSDAGPVRQRRSMPPRAPASTISA